MALGKGLGSLIPQKGAKRTGIHKETSGTENGQLWHIPLSEIVPNPEQPRKHFDHAALESLVASIKEHGVMQPITVSERMDGGYEIIAGERRFRASQIAGLPTIPAVVRAATEQQKLELALIENIQRQDLNPIEEAFSYKRLIDEFGLTQNDVALRVGKSRPAVANTMRLLDLPDVIQKALIDGQISEGKGRALLGIKDEAEQLRMFRAMLGADVSVRQVEDAVAKRRTGKGSTRRDANILAYEERLEGKVGSKVRITQKGSKGKIQIEYYSPEELERILKTLL